MDNEACFSTYRPASVRRAELRRLVGTLDGLRPGVSRIVEVSGDPGTGKTLLLAEFQQQLRKRGLSTLSGWCSESERGIPLHAFAPILEGHLFGDALDSTGTCHGDILPELPDLPAGDLPAGYPAPGGPAPGDRPDGADRLRRERSRFSAYQAVRHLITRRVNDGVALLLDDFHWADPCSVELLSYLVRWPVKAPLLLVVAHRPRQASPALRGGLSQGVAAGAVERIDLRPLSVRQSAELLGVPLPDPRVERLHGESRGNPLYLLALAREGGADGGRFPAAPECAAGHDDLTPGELLSLPPEEWQVTAAAVLLGDDADIGAIASVTGLPLPSVSSVVGRLMGRDLLRSAGRGRPGAVVLRHPALRSLLYRQVDSDWLVAAHGRAAELLARRGAPTSDQAAHLEYAQPLGDRHSTDVLVQGAREVMNTEPLTAVRWLQLALRSLDQEQGRPPAQLRRLEVTFLLAKALGRAGQLVESRRLLHAVLLLLPEEPTALQASASAFCALVECVLGHRTEAQALLDAQARSGRPVPFAETVDLQVAQAFLWLLGGRFTGPVPDSVPVPAGTGERAPLPEAGLLAARALYAMQAGSPAEAARLLEQSAAALDGLSDSTVLRRPEYLALLAMVEMQLQRYQDARNHFRRGARMLRKAGQFHLLPLMLTGVSIACAATGPLSEMRRAAAEAQEPARRIGVLPMLHAAVALEALSSIWAGSGDWDRAIRTIDEATALLPPAVSPWAAGRAWSMANAARPTGDPQRVISTIVQMCGGPELPAVPVPRRPEYFEVLAQAAAATVGSTPSAATWSHLALTAARSLPGPTGMPYALAARAHVRRSRREFRVAIRLYREAAELFSTMGLAVDQLRMTVLGAATAAGAGLAGQAADLLGQVRKLAGELGADRLPAGPAAEQAAPRAPSAGAEWAPARDPESLREPLRVLTAREQDVAHLAGTGMPTKEIAKRLLLSPRTVGVHLTHIYQKLQLRSRTELVRFMARLDTGSATREP